MQGGCYLLELSPDWIVRRASENIHRLLKESHVTLIDEPLGRFVHAQALHDVRNLFSRLSGTTGIGRAYAVRLTDHHDLVDIAFQLIDGGVLLEAVPTSSGFGEAFGTVGGLIAGLPSDSGQALLDGAARRMRALTGYDRVTITSGDCTAESSRGGFAGPASAIGEVPAIVGDCSAAPVAIFPRGDDRMLGVALLRSPDRAVLDQFAAAGVRASLRVPFQGNGVEGVFQCDSRTPRTPSFECHAAAELFAQMFALRLEIEQLRGSQAAK
ncbi:MAG: GAF domain-containing protein [Sphingomicrobium sp.]